MWLTLHNAHIGRTVAHPMHGVGDIVYVRGTSILVVGDDGLTFSCHYADVMDEGYWNLTPRESEK